jgi:hypothetical protein
LIDSTDSEPGVEERPLKLALLLTGREVMGDVSVGVWANGNFLAGDWKAYEPAFASVPAVWGAICAAHAKYGVHTYRDAPNNHGHGNAFPSYWAYGVFAA